MIRWWRK